MKIRIITLLLLALIVTLLAIQVSAVTTIDLDIKPQFQVGEDAIFNYTFISDKDEDIEYVVSIDCPSAPLPLLELKTVQLKKDIPFTEPYFYLKISDDLEPQRCEVNVSILQPTKIIKQQSFDIVADPSFEFRIKTCKDRSCSRATKVFILNDDIHLDYFSEVQDILVTGTITLPDKTTKQVTLPTSIKAGQLGLYNLEIKASKEGYKKMVKKVQVGVIEKEANIPYTYLVKEEKQFLWVVVQIILLALLVLITSLYVLKMRKLRK